jgi:mycothiol synthase
VSNFLLRRDDGVGLAVRPVRRAEIEPALRLILSGHNAGNDTAAVAEFLQAAQSRSIDLTTIWVVADDVREKLAWATLPMSLAGRATLLMGPPRWRPGVNARHVAELVAGALLESKRRGASIAQVMLDPQHRAVQRAMLDSGFEDIAELVYLSRQVRNPIAGRILSDQFRLWRYDRATHFRFGQCIERTYVDSLDCPRLNGRRAIDDIIDGHKAAGEFDPELWMLLSDLDNVDLGVLLLNRLHDRQGYELVYIGLTPEARGRKLADALIRTALNTLATEGGGQIITACDATNAPARKLYHRHGFGQMYARRALVRDL